MPKGKGRPFNKPLRESDLLTPKEKLKIDEKKSKRREPLLFGMSTNDQQTEGNKQKRLNSQVTPGKRKTKGK